MITASRLQVMIELGKEEEKIASLKPLLQSLNKQFEAVSDAKAEAHIDRVTITTPHELE